MDERHSRLSLRSPESRRHVAVSTGAGKSHLSIAITANCIRKRNARARFFNVVDLVNRLEAEARAGVAGRLAEQLTRVDLVALDEALQALARFDSRKAEVVELRFFGGLSVEETAEVLKVSPITVLRDWSTAKAWLYRELSGQKSDGHRSLETDR